MRIWRTGLVFLLSFQLISCATILHGSTEQVEILSSVSDTKIYVNDVYRGIAGPEAPLEVTIPKRGRVTFVGKKENCDSREQVVRRSVDPATFLGVLIDGGLISILLVDIVGTNAFVHANQSSYLLEPECRS
ncbi:MAG: hypothetical protein JNM24_01095 [Bdellovibrionaceae bacterium]|nr:hypothetical protein [Pseudobdellovibrionaceae bacterium]